MPARTLAKLRFEEEPALTIRAFTLQAQNQAAMTGSASCRRAQTRRHTKVNAQDASNAHLPRPPEILALRAVLAGHEASWTSYFLRVRSRHRWIGAASVGGCSVPESQTTGICGKSWIDKTSQSVASALTSKKKSIEVA